MSTNNEDTLRQFCDVTGADEARSKFFLESSNWQLEVALSSFYENGGNADEAPAPTHPTAAPLSLPQLSDMDSDMESPPGSPLSRPQKKEKKKKTTNTKFATLDSLQQESSSDEEEESICHRIDRKYFCSQASCSKQHQKQRDLKIESKDSLTSKDKSDTEVEKLKKQIESLTHENSELKREIARLKGMDADANEPGQAFYAGGSERSGQQILGPPGKSKKDIVTEMFKSVRERGAVVFEDEPSTAGRGRGGPAFSGVGYRLGQAVDDHEPVAEANTQQQESTARSVRLRLYREGFTVDSGAIRHYNDPENAEFLSCIRRGEIPPELAGGVGEVRVSLEDRRHEECPRAGCKPQAFTGKGQMLGSPTPPTVGATAPVAADVGDRAANQRAAQAAVGLVDSQPATTIQFRLADGSRITGRFNHTHTVADLQQYIARAEPAYQLTTFALLTTFPSAELSDPTVTLAQGNLLNTTLLQRLK